MKVINISKPIIIVGTTIVDHQMAVIVVHVGKNMVDNILLDGGSGINAIIDGLRWKLRLSPPQLVPFNLRMVDFSFNKPLGIIPNIKIKIYGIQYMVTFMVMNNKVVGNLLNATRTPMAMCEPYQHSHVW
jgi:hypothetical protein